LVDEGLDDCGGGCAHGGTGSIAATIGGVNRRVAEANARRVMALRVAAGVIAILALWIAGDVVRADSFVVGGVGIVAYVILGWEAARACFRQLSRGRVGVDTLMLLAAAGAAALGDWYEGSILLFLFSISETLQAYILGRNQRSIEALLQLQPDRVTIRGDDGSERLVALDALRVGDRVLVRPGERIAADGVVSEGHTSVDQSPVTGESIPVEKSTGDTVFAASLNQTGAIVVEVVREVKDSTLARIVRLVAQARKDRASSQRLSDWFGSRYTMAVLIASVATLAIGVARGGEPFRESFYRAMTVLVVGSPCAVVISVPAAILAAIAGAARRGLLFKGGIHLETAGKIRAVAIDKTGTLTRGRPRLIEARGVMGVDGDFVLAQAAAVEIASEHPLAATIVAGARTRLLELPAATETEALVGHGVSAMVGGRKIWVGKPKLMESLRLQIPDELAAGVAERSAMGETVVFVAEAERVLGFLTLADELRPGALEAIQRLKAIGVSPIVMLTGDHEGAAVAIADRLAIEQRAELVPEDKLREVRRLRDEYGCIAMVGDGINDAPALAAANLGVSLGISGTDVALETADLVVMGSDLRLLPIAIELGRRASRVITQNLTFAFGVMAVLLAATFLTTLRLPLAVLGHEGSTVLVILNGLRLLRVPAAREGVGMELS
jgi:Cd2+/Zn2+-exporting ATPase